MYQEATTSRVMGCRLSVRVIGRQVSAAAAWRTLRSNVMTYEQVQRVTTDDRRGMDETHDPRQQVAAKFPTHFHDSSASDARSSTASRLHQTVADERPKLE